MTYKFCNARADPKLGIAKVFPTYGLAPLTVSAKKSAEVSESQLFAEAKNHDKLYFRQKYFMKDFMEELIRSNVNPNKR